MKIPKEVVVMGKSYTVGPLSEECGDFGRCMAGNQRIQIKANQAPGQLRDTLLHEVLHAVSYELYLELEERQVHILANGLLDTLRRNPKFTQFLLEV
jgi:hypothetical protein